MKNKAPVAILIAAAAAAVWFLWQRAGPDGETAAGLIAGNGTIEATEVEVSARLLGRLVTLTAREGETVAAGEVIATLESGELEGQAAQARGTLAGAESSLAELEAGTRPEEIRQLSARFEAARLAGRQAEARLSLVRSGAREELKERLRAAVQEAQVAYDDAGREFERFQSLYENGAVPMRERDLAETRRDLAAARLEAARQGLVEAEHGSRAEEIAEAEAAAAAAAARAEAARAALDLARSGPRAERIASARARVDQARGALRTAEVMLDQARIVSPVTGTVTLRGAEAGEVVTPGLPIVRLADLSLVWLRVYIPEPRMGLVKLGQRAEVTVDSYPGRTFPGRVVEIAQKPEFTPKNVQTREERVKLVFGVKVEIENPASELKPGMPADAVIHTAAGAGS